MNTTTTQRADQWRMTKHANGLIKVESADRVIFDGFKGEERNAIMAAAAPDLAHELEEMIDTFEGLIPLDDYQTRRLESARAVLAKLNPSKR